MITLHILQLLEDNGFGTIDTDLFWEEVPIDSSGNPKDGIWIVTRGTPVSRLNHQVQNFDIYSRYTNKVTGSQKLVDILDFLQQSYGEVCELPDTEDSNNTFTNVRITPTSNIENVGSDDNNKTVRVISGSVAYERS